MSNTLYMTVFWICVGVAIIVFGIMIYAIIYHRKSAKHEAAPFHKHLFLEIIWAIIPIIILIAIAIPAAKTLIHRGDTSDAATNIKVET